VIVVSGPEVVTWVHLKLNARCPDRNLARGLGWVDAHAPWHIRAGVTYHNWNGYNIDAAVAIDDGFHWTRSRIRTIFEYPFTQLGARRMSALIEHDNTQSRRFVERLGFTLEATLAHACKAGDLLLYRMTSTECRWL
jgi:hypothetical protein